MKACAQSGGGVRAVTWPSVQRRAVAVWGAQAQWAKSMRATGVVAPAVT